MRIYRNQKINKTPILKIRNFFTISQRCRTDTFTLQEVCKFFEIHNHQANSLLKDLKEQGFIEKNSFDYYKTTLKGAALRNERGVPPIKRVKTDKIVNDFMQRVEEINSNDYYQYTQSWEVFYIS